MARRGQSQGIVADARAAVVGPVTPAFEWLRTRTTEAIDRLGKLSEESPGAVLHQASRLAGHGFAPLHSTLLRHIEALHDSGSFAHACALADAVIADCERLRRPFCVPAIRAHGERARCMRRLDRHDEAVEEFELVLRAASHHATPVGESWLLGYRFDLALTRREMGRLEESTEALRSLVPAMVTAYGVDSAWTVATVTQLASNLAVLGDPDVAADMVATMLPASSRLRGPLSPEALTLRSKVARWSTHDGMDRLAAARAVVDFTRAGLATCAEACELRYEYAMALFDAGETDYAIAQLASLGDDLATTDWSDTVFAASVRADLDAWRQANREGQA